MRIHSSMRLILLAILFLAAPADGQERTWRILISNDDGIHAGGIAALADALSEFAEVVVVAPAENESGSSHRSIVRTRITTLLPVHRDNRLFGYSIDASPADAVKFGILHFGQDDPFDLVVTGINDGANVGLVAHTSGTVGAAVEALLHGIPAIAVSQGRRPDYELSATFAADVVREVLDRGLPDGVALSINVPAGEVGGVRIRPMGGLYFRVAAVEQTEMRGDSILFRARTGGAYGVEPGSDTADYLGGFITVTPLQIDWTHYETIAELESWNLTVP